MSCRILAHTSEEVRNLIKNRKLLFQLGDNLSKEDILDFFKFTQEHTTLTPKERYEFMGVPIAHRPSDKASASFQKKTNAGNKFDKLPDYIRRREGGTFIHDVLQRFVDFHYNGVGSKGEIRDAIRKSKFDLSEKALNKLEETAKNLIKQIEKQQELINAANGTNEKATILVEQRVLDPLRDTLGTMDVVAIFSDMTASIYDYKTRMGYTKKLGNTYELQDDLLHEAKIDDNNLVMTEYKDITLNRYGIKAIRESRLIPIHMQLEMKPKGSRAKHDLYTNNIIEIQNDEDSEYLKQIPVAGELTKFKGINNLLERQMGTVSRLEEKLKKKDLSKEEKQVIRERLKEVRRAIRKTIVNTEIDHTLNDIISILNNFNSRISVLEFDADGNPNPEYMNLQELRDFVEELEVFEDLAKNTAKYLEDVREIDPETFSKKKTRINNLAPAVQRALEIAKTEQEKRILDLLPSRFKDLSGNLESIEGLNAINRNFLNLSEINHPIFIAFNKLKEEATYDLRQDTNKIIEEIEEAEKKLIRWAKSNGVSKQAAFNKLIDFETGNLVKVFNSEIFAKRDAAINNENVNFLRENFESRLSKDEFMKKFTERRNRYIEIQKNRLNQLKEVVDEATGEVITTSDQQKYIFNKRLKDFDEQNNIFEYKSAWLNPDNYKYGNLVLKESKKEQNYTEQYKSIKSIPELYNYYNFFTEKISQLREVLGETYGDMPRNFVPNIRKSMLEQLVENHSIAGTLKEFRDSFNYREEDVYLAPPDSRTGEPVRTIPKLFLNSMDVKEKSFDLSKNLVIFSKMAYNYKHMSEIEAQTLALKDMLGNPSYEQGGEQITDRMNKPVKGKLGSFITNLGKSDTKTYELFRDITDYYLYGVRYKEKSLFENIDTTKGILNLKNYYSKRALAFAVIPGIGAAIAGSLGIHLEGKKGQSYTKKHAHNTKKFIVTDYHKYMGITHFYDAYSEDPIQRKANSLSARKIIKYGDERYMFYPIRTTDEKITDFVLVSMAQNYGFDEEGNLVRLNRKGRDYSNIKSIWDRSTVDKKTGKVTVDGLTKANYIAFRSAVKATVSNIVGNMSSEDISGADLSLGLSLVMQFKTWMPGIMRERLGKIRYDEHIQALREGRYNAYFSQFTATPSPGEQYAGSQIGYFFGQVLKKVPNLLLDLSTFGLSNKLGIKRVNEEQMKLKYNAWKFKMEKKYPELAKDITYEEFLEMKRGQITAFVNELRIILLLASSFMYLAGDDEHGNPRYMANWATRTAYKAFVKGYSELTFMWNINEFVNLIKNPIPLSGLGVSFYKTTQNTFDEVRDLTFGENSPQDKTPFFYYSVQWLYGGTQLARFLEFFEEYKKVHNR